MNNDVILKDFSKVKKENRRSNDVQTEEKSPFSSQCLLLRGFWFADKSWRSLNSLWKLFERKNRRFFPFHIHKRDKRIRQANRGLVKDVSTHFSYVGMNCIRFRTLCANFCTSCRYSFFCIFHRLFFLGGKHIDARWKYSRKNGRAKIKEKLKKWEKQKKK